MTSGTNLSAVEREKERGGNWVELSCRASWELGWCDARAGQEELASWAERPEGTSRRAHEQEDKRKKMLKCFFPNSNKQIIFEFNIK